MSSMNSKALSTSSNILKMQALATSISTVFLKLSPSSVNLSRGQAKPCARTGCLSQETLKHEESGVASEKNG